MEAIFTHGVLEMVTIKNKSEGKGKAFFLLVVCNVMLLTTHMDDRMVAHLMMESN